MPLLSVQNLTTAFQTDEGLLTAVDGVSFSIEPGQTVGLVGESGCGKSVTAFSINRLLPQPSGRILSGAIRFDGKDLTQIPDDELRAIRGRDIGMIFQEPMAALNPVHRIGRQLSEVFLLHTRCSKKQAWDQSIALLRKVGIPEPEQRAMDYPHQLSGGMKQRVVIAMAIALKPKLVIADEPTTALDVTVQAQILALMKDLQKEMGMGLLLITHDLGVIAETCDEVVVMYAGRVVEQAPVRELFSHPRHAYTRGLLASIPRLSTPRRSRLRTIPGTVPPLHLMPAGCRFCPRNGAPADSPTLTVRPPFIEAAPHHFIEACPRCSGSGTGEAGLMGETGPLAPVAPKPAHQQKPLLEVKNLRVFFPVKTGVFQRTSASVKAVDEVSLTLQAGETLGLIGESGCGKTTLGKAIVRLHQPTGGTLTFQGIDLTNAGPRVLKPHRRDLQMIFQDPAESLNSRHTVGTILEEPFIIHRMGTPAERRTWVAELLEKVGLPAGAANKFPFEFSGGQRQRIGIARAIAVKPKLIVCDEPVSALDVSVQSQVINLLLDLQKELGLSYLFIAHNLAVVKHISDRIAIMYLGRIVETGPADEVYQNPRHPYTKALIAAIPEGDFTRTSPRPLLSGDIPSPIHPPPGCTFGHRVQCANYQASLTCDPSPHEVSPGHFIQACPCALAAVTPALGKTER